jgi:chromatin remodeling complex protein RSC6
MADKKTTGKGGSSAFMAPVIPDATLAAVVGGDPMPRTEITKKIWEYIREHKLQDAQDKRKINADAKLKALFGGQDSATMFELTKYVNAHVKKG